jgi:hypothetical protein
VVLALELTVKDVFLELKNNVFTGKATALEAYSADVANRSILSALDVKTIYRNLIAMKKYVTNPTLSQNKRVIWDSSEDAIIMQYYKLAIKETIDVKGVKKKKTQGMVLAELVDILCNRTESSIPFRYRQLVTNKIENKPNMKGLSIVKTIAQNSENSAQISIVEDVVEIVEKEKDDLLDIVVDTIENLDIAEVDITDLFKGILKLSKRAVQSSNMDKVKELEEQNKALEEQVRVLKGRNQFIDGELIRANERTQEAEEALQRMIQDISSVWREIDQFERLTGKQKLKQINGHSTRMKYIVQQFGNVDIVAN